MADTAGYKNIFKSTFLFGFVQIFNIIVKVGLNKVVAIILGPEGMGVISLFQTSINLFCTGGGLGINQSAVRDISEARGSENENKLNLTISFTRKIIRYTSILGVILMTAFAPFLSEYTFGNKDYTLAYAILSLAVGASIQTNGYRAINTGVRQLRNVAYSTMWGSLAGLASALPLYYFLGEHGIVPSLVISSITTMVIARYYANKVPYNEIKTSLKEAIHNSSNMIKMGVALMLMSFMLFASQFIISAYVSEHGGRSMVGLYQAGATIITGYFGIIITAMSTEYYPRISSFYSDNEKLKDAVNAQSEIGLLMAMPLVVIFLLLTPFFLKFLYTDKFLSAAQYIEYAVLGTLAIICSNCMGMIMLAKQNSKMFLLSSAIMNVVIIMATIALYKQYGLSGLGIAYMANGLLQFIVYNLMMKIKYDICFSKLIILTLLATYIVALLASYIREHLTGWSHILCGSLLTIASASYSLWQAQRRLGINPVKAIINILKK